MKTETFVREVRKEAKVRGLSLDFERSGREHDLYRVGKVRLAVPRHGELSSGVELQLRKDLQPVFGERWWR